MFILFDYDIKYFEFINKLYFDFKIIVMFILFLGALPFVLNGCNLFCCDKVVVIVFFYIPYFHSRDF